MKIIRVGTATLVLLVTGCAHQVTFDKPEHYEDDVCRLIGTQFSQRAEMNMEAAAGLTGYSA